ncbi:hypothetical protein [Mesomycoplasma hyorhinis]|uniref:hypothetical protein n=1 Tax=Mesomycoplasma hyorhinis TaxID=2100 RepID=UPI000243A7DE|nr:hypothetical protein [Mesomycoplasma hyorhinis]AEX13893.1 hypothetical protein MYM_0090 [Mesomycoplasma hyorhinis GDL-1]AHA40852.1 hypothetical protein Q453_0098 [Mesomycoplasma hyorhinis DBS 1050]MXR08531.1 hypothetical protein [Mesomycoplasma hyorhinis]VEU57609.1 Uncharacterised protein [Mesomycoplasma hyorhinis]
MKIINSNFALIATKIIIILVFLFLFVSEFIDVNGVSTLSDYLFGVVFGWYTPMIYLIVIFITFKYKTTLIFTAVQWKSKDIFFLIFLFLIINWISIYFQYFLTMKDFDPKFLAKNSIITWWNLFTSSNNDYHPFVWNAGFLSFLSFAIFGAIFTQYGIISISFLLLVLWLIYFGYKLISNLKKSTKLTKNNNIQRRKTSI